MLTQNVVVKYLSFVSLALILSSCGTVTETQMTDSVNVPRHIVQSDSISGIRFEFTAQKFQSNDLLLVKCTLFNDNSDTAYYVTSTCAGEIYSLQYDTALFALNPMILCNASYPELGKIPPNGQFNFETHFLDRKNSTVMELGFDFFKVKSTFDPGKLTLMEIHGRPIQNRTVLWKELNIE